MPPDSGTSDRAPPRNDPGAPIQTDRPAYLLVRDDQGWGARIPFEFTNPAPDTLYAINCNGAITLALEKKAASEWEMFWMPMTNACLSPPVVIPPGGAFRDTVDLWGAPPGGNVGPEFRTTDLTGTYRLIWANLVSHYSDGIPQLGDTVPTAYRVSNEFELRPGQ